MARLGFTLERGNAQPEYNENNNVNTKPITVN